ncbi:MAG: pyridoxal phosphate-dependent aminotransferase [Rhodospirillum sp.]|nr:pyridoxal phosphate-dependent aminotransferase [Rhodospirillum sp.]MCF8489613.1 pyridoxal phosphate-dependent aminotransferase [Rhodospirillum sp.]MCF8499644.1 pyridoxal phosphate-dependent aminotransferase [Rhodospirillum sp.]
MAIPTPFPPAKIIALTTESVPYDLAESIGPDVLVGDLLKEGVLDDVATLPLGYGSAQGHPDLRALIADHQGAEAEDVVVTVGGMQALFLLAFILAGPGKDVVLGAPAFPNAKAVVEAVGTTPRLLPFAFGTGYRLEPERLKEALTPATTLVSLASPQNPSGVSLTEMEVRQVLAAMDRTCPEALLLVDETFREAVAGATPIRPSLTALDPRVVTIASLSKCHGAPGLRLGWVITRNAALRDQLILGKFTTVVSHSAVDEALALRVLARQTTLIADRRPVLGRGLARTEALVTANADLLDWVKPDAGAICCLRLRESGMPESALPRFYDGLRARGVRVAPGSWFGETDRVFRLGFGLLSPETFERALALLAEAARETAGVKGGE